MRAETALRACGTLPIVLALASCDGDSGGAEGDASAGATSSAEGGTSADSGPSGTMVEGMGTVLDAISGDAVETAEVCLFMEYDVGCVYTDGSGAFALPSLPSGALRATQIGKSGHAPVISWFTVPESGWSSTARLVPQDVTDVIVDDLGGGQDTSRGHIVVRAVDGSGAPVEGASLETVPPTQNDPAYLGDDGMPSPDLSATGPNGLIVIPNVVEGAIDVRVTDAGGNNCLPDVVSEIGDDPSMTRLRVLAGHWAAAPGFDFTCG